MTDEQRTNRAKEQQRMIDAWNTPSADHCDKCGQLHVYCNREETGRCDTSNHVNMKRGGEYIGHNKFGERGTGRNFRY